jgi:hypothetical protein
MTVTNIECHTNPSSGGRGDTYVQTEGRTHITKLQGAIRDYANAPEEAPRDPAERERGEKNKNKIKIKTSANHGTETFG